MAYMYWVSTIIILSVVWLTPVCSNSTQEQSGPTKGYSTTPEQDSAYKQAMKVRIPVDVRLRHDLIDSEYNPIILQEVQSIMSAYINVMNLPSSVFQPRREEWVQRKEMIADALSVPGLYRYNDMNAIFYLEDAAVFLGLAEDVSPTISYRLDYADIVEIVVYSVQAKVIATLFSGKQPAGSHQITWNLKNDVGMPMPSGDYVAEVRIGSTKYVRKRIQIK